MGSGVAPARARRAGTRVPAELATTGGSRSSRAGHGLLARELSLSTSTVRSHLHDIYGKLGAIDRAQAVLLATRAGWIAGAGLPRYARP
jgi:hypothetical protein